MTNDSRDSAIPRRLSDHAVKDAIVGALHSLPNLREPSYGEIADAIVAALENHWAAPVGSPLVAMTPERLALLKRLDYYISNAINFSDERSIQKSRADYDVLFPMLYEAGYDKKRAAKQGEGSV